MERENEILRIGGERERERKWRERERRGFYIGDNYLVLNNGPKST